MLWVNVAWFEHWAYLSWMLLPPKEVSGKQYTMCPHWDSSMTVHGCLKAPVRHCSPELTFNC
jgi:hypothetical protein